MMNKELKRIEKVISNSMHKEFIEEILNDPQYKGKEDFVLSVLDEFYSKIITESDPYKWEMVSPKQFLEDPYYCGVNPKTGVGVVESMYPMLKKDFKIGRAHV